MSKPKWKTKGGIGSGTLYVVLILLAIMVLSFELVGGKLPSPQTTNPNGQPVIIDTPTPDPNGGKKNLQLYTFNGHAPTPPPSDCEHSSINREDTMVIGFDPSPGKTVGNNGDIRAWVTDEGPPKVSLGEVVDPATGNVTTRGNTATLDTCSSGNSLKISWEPSLYIGSKAYYPDVIKGSYFPSNNCAVGRGSNGPALDSFTNFQTGTPGLKQYGPGRTDGSTAEFIWHVSSLGLSQGNYSAKTIVHDGDREIGIFCANISVQ